MHPRYIISALIGAYLLFIFTPSIQGQWFYGSRIVPATGNIVNNGNFGQSVCISPTGLTLAVGAHLETVSGAANAGSLWIYTRSGLNWLYSTKLTPSSTTNMYVGYSITTTDTRMIGGSHQDNSGAGAIYPYTYQNSLWQMQGKITVTTASGTNFGYSLATDGTILIAGAYAYSGGNGAVCVFTISTGSWALLSILTNTVSGSHMGLSVGLSTNFIISGAHDLPGNTGAAYLWTRSGSTINPTYSRLSTTTSLVQYSDIGYSIGIVSSTLIALGCGQDNPIYIFTYSPGTGWTNSGTLTAPNYGSYFGNSLSYSSPYLLVGDWSKKTSFVFSFSGTAWSAATQIIPTDTVNPSGGYGYCVWTAGGFGVIGDNRSYVDYASGAVFMFYISQTTTRSSSRSRSKSRSHSKSKSRSQSKSRSRSHSKSNSRSRSKSRSRSHSKSRSYTRSKSRSYSHSKSRSHSRSLSRSQSRSKSRSQSQSPSQSKSQSNSQSHSKSSSLSQSHSRSNSPSQSHSNSYSRSQSKSLSRSRSASKSQSKSRSNSSSKSLSQSRTISKTKTRSFSKSKSPTVAPIIKTATLPTSSKSEKIGYQVSIWNKLALISVPFCYKPTISCDGGYFLIYKKVAGDWTFFKKTRNPFYNRDVKFGYSMVAQDTFLAISAPASMFKTSPVGIVLFYLWDSIKGTFMKESRIRYKHAVKPFDFGKSLSFYNNVTAVSSPGFDFSNVTNSGCLLVFRRSHDGKWTERNVVVNPIAPTIDEYFGSASSFLTENVIAVSNRPADVALQAVFIFKFEIGDWRYSQKISNRSKLGFGWKISFHGYELYISAVDSSVICVYGLGTNGEFAFTYDIAPTHDIPGERFGYSFDIHVNRMVVGANPCDEGQPCNIRGNVYSFERGGGPWTQQRSFALGLPDGTDGYGFDVAIDDNTILVSAPFDSTKGPQKGAAYFIQ